MLVLFLFKSYWCILLLLPFNYLFILLYHDSLQGLYHDPLLGLPSNYNIFSIIHIKLKWSSYLTETKGYISLEKKHLNVHLVWYHSNNILYTRTYAHLLIFLTKFFLKIHIPYICISVRYLVSDYDICLFNYIWNIFVLICFALWLDDMTNKDVSSYDCIS